MNVALAWVALAAAVALAPAARRSGSRQSAGHRSGQRQASGRGLLAAAAVSTGALCVGLLGPVHGVLASGVLVPSTVWLVVRLRRRPGSAAADPALPFTLDLTAAVLRTGQPVSVAIALAAPAAGPATARSLGQVAGLLRLGADPAEAWRTFVHDERLAPLAQAARRSSSSGVRLADAWEQLATDLRAEMRSAALARAHRAGVLAIAPLGLCFLPAFVCLGVIPDVIGMAKGAFGVYP
jgi:Flp pilus assembly protein TadB